MRYYRITISDVSESISNEIIELYDYVGVGSDTAIGGLGDILERVCTIADSIKNFVNYTSSGGFDDCDPESWDIDGMASLFNISRRTARRILSIMDSDTGISYGYVVSQITQILYPEYRFVELSSGYTLPKFLIYDPKYFDESYYDTIFDFFSNFNRVTINCETTDGEFIGFEGVYLVLITGVDCLKFYMKLLSSDCFEYLRECVEVPELNAENTCIYFKDDKNYICNEEIGEQYFGFD